MDQNRLLIFIVLAVAILIGFQVLTPHHAPAPLPPATRAATPVGGGGVNGSPVPATPPGDAAPANVPRVTITAPRVAGSISLLGARIDDVVLRDYHDTVDPKSPLVHVLSPLSSAQPYYAEYGWTTDGHVALPDAHTLWKASGGEVSSGHPVTLSWDNGAGLLFQLAVSVDDDYMFSVQQSVHNAGNAPVVLHPYARIWRDYTPVTTGYSVLHEGFVGVLGGTVKQVTYKGAKSAGDKNGGVAFSNDGSGGWAGFTDKYWLAALVPDQAAAMHADFDHLSGTGDRYLVGYISTDPGVVAAGAQASTVFRLFVGAKEVHLLDRYETRDHIPLFSYAVDFGHFFFLTKPIFYALDWLNSVLGNFGLAILVFTLGVKALFFPLASRSYQSMGKMRLLGPKIQAMRERYKDDPARQQSEMMAIYKAEKVNPASGCLPMVIQLPVFFSLYKDILVTIELRHAPFFGWVHDLSVTDPTNVFNLFGLLPFDPTGYSPLLHLGVWPLVMGATMYFMQKLNPPPPDPAQARMMQFMPLIFMFMMARFPAGLVIYWSWNNTLTMAQQWFIQRQAKLSSPRAARA